MGFLKFFYPLLTRFQCTPVFLNCLLLLLSQGGGSSCQRTPVSGSFWRGQICWREKKKYKARELEKAGKRPDLKRVQRKMKCTGTGPWLILALKGCKAGYSLFFWLKLTPLFNCRF